LPNLFRLEASNPYTMNNSLRLLICFFSARLCMEIYQDVLTRVFFSRSSMWGSSWQVTAAWQVMFPFFMFIFLNSLSLNWRRRENVVSRSLTCRVARDRYFTCLSVM
jgi:hypothetical protein